MTEIERKCLLECMEFVTFNSNSQLFDKLYTMLEELRKDCDTPTDIVAKWED